jgi:hypothetical protein
VAAPVLQLRVPEDTLNRIDIIRGTDTRSAWLHPGLRGKPACFSQPKSGALPQSRGPIRTVLTDHCP